MRKTTAWLCSTFVVLASISLKQQTTDAAPPVMSHVPFQSGDVFVSVTISEGIGTGKVQHRDAFGNLLEVLDTGILGETVGQGFDRAGNLYVTNFSGDFSNVTRFNSDGSFFGPFGSGYAGANPESIVFDRQGNAYVGCASADKKIREFDPHGNPVAQFAAAVDMNGTDWIDLGHDQCTIFYTSEGQTVKRFNVCTNSQLPDFGSVGGNPGAARTVRLLPLGGALVADLSAVVRLDSGGQIAQTYTVPNKTSLSNLALDPDGSSFWVGNTLSADVFKIDMKTGSVLTSFNTGTGLLSEFGLGVEPGVLLKDDFSGNLFQFNPQTGLYQFTRCGDGFTLGGAGHVTAANGYVMLFDARSDRRITATFNRAQLTGSAVIQIIPAPGLIQTIRINSTTVHPLASCP